MANQEDYKPMTYDTMSVQTREELAKQQQMQKELLAKSVTQQAGTAQNPPGTAPPSTYALPVAGGTGTGLQLRDQSAEAMWARERDREKLEKVAKAGLGEQPWVGL